MLGSRTVVGLWEYGVGLSSCSFVCIERLGEVNSICRRLTSTSARGFESNIPAGLLNKINLHSEPSHVYLSVVHLELCAPSARLLD